MINEFFKNFSRILTTEADEVTYVAQSDRSYLSLIT